MGEAELKTLPERPRPLPEEIVVDTANLAIRMTPNELRALKAETGRSMEDLMGEGAEMADRLQAISWLRLRREGYAVSWAEAGDVGVRFETSEAKPPDPTSGDTSATSPGSVTSGA